MHEYLGSANSSTWGPSGMVNRYSRRESIGECSYEPEVLEPGRKERAVTLLRHSTKTLALVPVLAEVCSMT